MMRDNTLKNAFLSFLIGAIFMCFTLYPLGQAIALGGGGPVPTDEELDQILYGDNTDSSTPGTGDTSGSAALQTDSSEDPYNFNVTNISDAIPAVAGCTGIVNKVKKTLDSFSDTVTSAFNGDVEEQLASIMDEKLQALEEKKSVALKSKETARQAKDNLAKEKPGTAGYTEAEKKAKAAEDTAKQADQDAANADNDAKKAADNYTKYKLPTTEQSVPISNSTLEKDTNKIKESNDKLKADAAQAKFREECINGVAYSLAKAQLAAMTQKTVNWINSGFGGDPLFVKDQDAYFESLGKDTVRTFLGPIADFRMKDLYPYGRDFARSTIQNNRATVQDKLQSTLRNSLQDGATEEDFANDFSKGGWNGWFALTQKPQNNPLGFNILATQELADKQARQYRDVSNELNQNNGFLSQKRCVEYDKAVPRPGYWNPSTVSASGDVAILSKDAKTALSTKTITETEFTISAQYDAPSAGNITAELQQNLAKKDSKTVATVGAKGKTLFNISFSGLTAGSTYTVYVDFNTSTSTEILKLSVVTAKSANGGNTPTATTDDNTNRNCLKWETVTPGTIIQDQLKTSLSSSTRQLELADSINESLSAVFAALTNQLINQGLESLSSFDPSSSVSPFGGPGSNKLYDSSNNEIIGGINGTLGNVLSVNRGHGWFSADKFDITTSLSDTYKWEGTGANRKKVLVKKGIITIQKDYIDAVNNSLKVLPKIVPALGELDYCIPGPNPMWEPKTRIQANALILYLKSIQITDDGRVILQDFKSFALRQAQGTPLGDVLIANSDAWYVKAWDGYKNIIESIPIVGGISKTIDAAKGAVYDVLASILGKPTRAEALKVSEENRQAAIAQKKSEAEQDIKDKIAKIRTDYTTYKAKIEELYGANSPMRDADPSNSWYLPMAEAGLDATRNIITYDNNIRVAKADYAEEVRKAKSNIYKLNIIKGKVDIIVAAAKKRLHDEILYKQLHGQYVDLSCYENVLDPGLAGTATANSSNSISAGDVSFTATPKASTNVGSTANPTACIVDLGLEDTSDAINYNRSWSVATATGKGLLKDPATLTAGTVSIPIDSVTGAGSASVTLTLKDKTDPTITASKTKTVAIQTMTTNSGGKACTTTTPDFTAKVTTLQGTQDQCYDRITILDKSKSPYGIKSYSWDASFDASNTGVTLNRVPGSSTFADGVSQPSVWIDASKISGTANGGKAILDIILHLTDDNGTVVDKKNSYSIPKVTTTPNGNACPVQTVPDAPTALSASAVTNGQSSLSWTAPAATAMGNSVVTDYIIEQSTTGTGGWSVFNDGVSKNTTATVTGLTNGSTYYFRVSSKNAVGTGSAGAVVSTAGNAGVSPDFDLTANESPNNTGIIPGYCDMEIKVKNNNVISGASSYRWILSMQNGNAYITQNSAYGSGATAQPPSPAFTFNAHDSYGTATIKLEVTGASVNKTLTKTININQITAPHAGHGTVCYQ